MPDIGSHLGCDLQMTLKHKNNHSNVISDMVISVHKLFKTDVSHQILHLLLKS